VSWLVAWRFHIAGTLFSFHFAWLDSTSQASYLCTLVLGRTFSAGAFFVAAVFGCDSTNWRLVMKNMFLGLALTLAVALLASGTAEAKKHHGSCGSYGSAPCAPACDPCQSYTSCGSCGDTVCQPSCGSCGDTSCYTSCGSTGKKVKTKKKHHGSYGSYGSCGTPVHHGSCGSAGW
jgi:hypothetical protein